ncbi:trypsin-like peptidase domain-containing protein [Halobacteria archaeon AArc-dxtr1]|nr:trypsin-like peptidase domain-containing protein [Halobacteria archaeon AArc-dxtr1]
MDESQLDRRQFLTLATAGAAGAIAGCTEPRADRSIGGSSSTNPDIDPENLADGSAFTDVYDAVIDSVAQLRVFGIDDPMTGEEGQGQGSGFLLGDHLVTNDHVIADGTDVDVQYTTGDWTGTSLVGRDFYSDLAVLEVDDVPDEAEPLSLTETQPVPGQQVVAVGNPFGLEGSISTGVVSGVNRSVPMPQRNFSLPNAVQTDAALNPGNSGGPLVDLEGEVVGVVNAGGGVNIGFAISAALTSRVVPALIEDGEFEHSYLGIGLDSVDRVVAAENDLPEATGVIVVTTEPDGPSDGVLEESDGVTSSNGEEIPVGGDVIVTIDNTPIPDRHALGTHLALETDPGDQIVVTVLRNGSETDVELTLGSRPPPTQSGWSP